MKGLLRTLSPTRSPARTGLCDTAYFVPGDAIHLRTNDPRIVQLADRLWDRSAAGVHASHGRVAPLSLSVDVSATPDTTHSSELLEERWRVDADVAELALGADHGHGRIELSAGRFAGRVSDALVANQPALVSRLLLETPAAALLALRGYCVVHAGAVVGTAGAVVIRGPGGAGKSTLVAAAHRAGLGVLGDESLLVERDDPDALLAAILDVSLLPDAVRLLDLDDAVTGPGSGAEPKWRLDLLTASNPAVRRARRVATVLLGSRTDGPARLEPLSPADFLAQFREGAIPQEIRFRTPDHVAQHWARHGAYRLSGATDLSGAVSLLSELVSQPAIASHA